MATRPARPLLVGICGGTASGKSCLASSLKAVLKAKAVIMRQDWYFRDRSGLTLKEVDRLNFDHPDAMEAPLMHAQLDALLAGRSVDAPLYDYRTHTRKRQTHRVDPAPVIIVEGIFVLHDAVLVRRLDLSVYIDVPADVRLMRRVRRDVEERKIALEETLRLYERFVRPMHMRYIQPSADRATWRWHQLDDKRFPQELIREVQARLRKL